MVRLLRLGLVALAVLVFSNRARADVGTISWTTDPKPGSSPGTILVDGSITADSGWVTASPVTVRVWVDGTVVSEFGLPSLLGSQTATFSDNGTQIMGLASGTTYNITAEVVVQNQSTLATVTIVTAPKVVTTN